MMMLSSCSMKSPTSPELHPFVGKWQGNYQSPLAGSSDNNSLKLNIISGGRGVGTALFLYVIDARIVMEVLFLELDISPAGKVTGNGTWFWTIEAGESIVGIGKINGEIDLNNMSGNGEVRISDGSGEIAILWEVSKTGN